MLTQPEPDSEMQRTACRCVIVVSVYSLTASRPGQPWRIRIKKSSVLLICKTKDSIDWQGGKKAEGPSNQPTLKTLNFVETNWY